MISHEHRFIFVHIQKTAGKSLLKPLGLPPGADHRFARQQRADYGEALWHAYFKFAFVRNPWDRLVSGYHYRIRGGSQRPGDLARAKLYPRSFRKFCRNLDRFMNLPDEHMFVPQWQWISDPQERMIIDFVGRYEALDQDFETVCRRLGLPVKRLPHVNQSKHRPYPDYYDRETRDLVARAYERDIELFGYSFDQELPESAMSEGFIRRWLRGKRLLGA
jgi:hypothetical protein